MMDLELRYAALATWLVKHYRHCLVFATIVTVAALSQVHRIRFDDDLRNLFRTADVETSILADRQNDLTCVAMIYGSPLITGDGLKVIYDLHRRLRELDCVANVTSMLDARQPRRVGRYFLPHFPGPDAPADRIQRSAAAAAGHPLLDGQLLTADQTATLMFVQLRSDLKTRAEIRDAVNRVQMVLEGAVERTDFEYALTGIPAIRIALADVSMRDQSKFVVGGCAVSLLIAAIIFRSVRVTLIILSGPLLGVLWTVAAMAVSGVTLNVVNGLVSPLALAIGLTAAVHMMFHYRRQRTAGANVPDAVHSMARIVLPACGWATLTTILGFATLGVARLTTIQHMGFVCAVAVALTFLALLSTLPALCLLLRPDFARSPNPSKSQIAARAGNWLITIAGHVVDHPQVCVCLGVVVMLGMLALATQLTPTICIAEGLPSSGDAISALELVEQRFGGALPITLVLQWPASTSGAEVLSAIVAAHEALEDQPVLCRPLSLISLLRSLPGDTLAQQRRQLRYVPDEIVDRVYDASRRQSYIFTRCADVGTQELEPFILEIERRMRGIESTHPGLDLTLTEIVVDAVRVGNGMIIDLGKSLFCAVPLISLVLIITFQSWRLGLVSIIPNVFPLAATAACIVLLGWHLRMFTVSLFAIFFGIAVDDTIHIMLRFRREVARGTSVRPAIIKALQEVGPAVITTTIVLSSGLTVLMISEVFGIRRFGVLFCCGLAWALIGDLVLLPACLAWLAGDPDRSADERS